MVKKLEITGGLFVCSGTAVTASDTIDVSITGATIYAETAVEIKNHLLEWDGRVADALRNRPEPERSHWKAKWYEAKKVMTDTGSGVAAAAIAKALGLA